MTSTVALAKNNTTTCVCVKKRSFNKLRDLSHEHRESNLSCKPQKSGGGVQKAQTPQALVTLVPVGAVFVPTPSKGRMRQTQKEPRLLDLDIEFGPNSDLGPWTYDFNLVRGVQFWVLVLRQPLQLQKTDQTTTCSQNPRLKCPTRDLVGRTLDLTLLQNIQSTMCVCAGCFFSPGLCLMRHNLCPGHPIPIRNPSKPSIHPPGPERPEIQEHKQNTPWQTTNPSYLLPWT